MTLTVKLGAKADGTLTAFQVRNVSNTGAYGNHGGETLFAGGAAVAIYRCPNKKFDAYSVYTNTVPSGALRGYGMTQPAFAVESAMDELARRAATWIRSSCGAATSCARAIALVALDDGPDDVIVQRGRPRRVHRPGGGGPGRRTADEPTPGAGLARRRRRRQLAARDRAADRAHLRGLGHARRRPHLRARRRDRRVRRGHLDRARPDRGEPARHDAVADPARAVRHRPHRLRHRGVRERRASSSRATRCCRRPTPCATASWRSPPRTPGVDPSIVRDGRRRRRLRRQPRHAGRARRAGPSARHPVHRARKAYGSPRSVTSNAHGFRIAVHPVTGEIRILYSVQATDAGVVINPAQVRGQIEGGVAQGIGFALTENFHVDADGVMVNPNLRNYRIPTYADIPRTEVLLVGLDRFGRADAVSKGMAECCINPVAPALANALEDATGVRYRALPLTPERIYSRLAEKFVDARPEPAGIEGHGDDATDRAPRRRSSSARRCATGSERGVPALAERRQRRGRATTRDSSAPRSPRRPPCSPTGSSSTASTRSPTCRPGSTARPGRSTWTGAAVSSTARRPSR